MKKTLIIIFPVFFCCLLFDSCHSIKRYKARPTIKQIKANTELEKGDLLYEDSRAILYFDRKTTLEILKNRLGDKYLTNCDKNRLIKYIENIEQGNTLIFDPMPFLLTDEALFNNGFEEDFKLEILQSLLLNCRFSVLNKSTGVYEKYLIYNRRHAGWGCCNTYFDYPNGDMFIITDIYTDNIVIEVCDE